MAKTHYSATIGVDLHGDDIFALYTSCDLNVWEEVGTEHVSHDVRTVDCVECITTVLSKLMRRVDWLEKKGGLID